MPISPNRKSLTYHIAPLFIRPFTTPLLLLWLILSMTSVHAESSIACRIKGPFQTVDPTYANVARQTGGQMLSVLPSEIIQTSSLMLGHLEWIDYYEASESTHETFPVDASIKQLSIHLNAQAPTTIEIHPPKADQYTNSLQAIRLSSLCNLRISDPSPGQWSFTVQTSGHASVSIKAKTPIQFRRYQYQKSVNGHHGPMMVTDKLAAGGQTSVMQLTLNEPSLYQLPLVLVVQNRLRKMLAEYPANSIDREHYIAKFRIPTTESYAYIVGKDAQGYPFKRRYSASIQRKP